VIYLTLSMQFAVRALSLLLIVWLTAAASFPPCCWSMASAHDHPARHDASRTDFHADAHHHHDNADSAMPATRAAVMSPIPAHNCHTESVEAVATTRVTLSCVGLRAAGSSSVDAVVPQDAALGAERSDYSPPGILSGSAFRNPLRL
jgi:hypothetical protein